MSEERLRILKMIQEGTISAEEGARLLDALESPGEETTRTSGDSRGRGRFLHVRVYDSVTGREKVNMNIPIGLAKMVGSLVPESQRTQLESHGIRVDDLLRAVESGRVGKVADISNNDQDEKVEVSIE